MIFIKSYNKFVIRGVFALIRFNFLPSYAIYPCFKSIFIFDTLESSKIYGKQDGDIEVIEFITRYSFKYPQSGEALVDRHFHYMVSNNTIRSFYKIHVWKKS